uniref:TRUD domain-containing protein n=1 Tax=Peronospora matthiolae TaxID=2874970 RepID=A0AAV1V597_9STRA
MASIRLKSSVLDGVKVGIEEFIDNRNDRLVVRGCIKTKPDDFIVREISADGEVVELNEESNCLALESERTAILKKLEAGQQKAKKERLEFDDPVDGWPAALMELVGAAGFQEVESVATRKTEEFLVASPVTMKERAFLQVCIQKCFPALDCKMCPVLDIEGQVVQQMRVVLDPVYRKLQDGGMAQENCDRLLTFLRKGASDQTIVKGLELEHEDTKEARTALHRLIAKSSSCFRTKTEARNNVQRLVVYFQPNKRNQKRKRSQPQVYLRFVLQKTNLEHFSAFEKLARRVRHPLSAFSYAGTKDKTAITFQHVAVSGVDPDQLLNVNTTEDNAMAGLRVGNLKYVETPIALGGSNGNRFSIVVWSLSSDTHCPAEMIRSTLESTLETIERHGFANYFGFQRVGLPTNTVRAHHIGEKMVASKWEEALRLMLAVRPAESEDAAKAKQHYLESGDIEAALKLMPLGMSVERQVLQGLKRFGSDAFEQAVQSIPFSRRMMYMHAYQSYIFNRVASFRLRHYGTKVVEGDLVQCDAQHGKAVKTITAKEATELNKTRQSAIGLVVLPLAGTNVVLPSNTTKDVYVKIMEQDDTKDALLESGPVKGAYRPLVAYPHDLEWTWHQDDDESLSLQISFSLDSGSFATMCLREVLHSDI